MPKCLPFAEDVSNGDIAVHLREENNGQMQL